MRYRDARMTVARLEALIDCFAVAGHCNRSVVRAFCGRSGDFSNAPCNAIIPGHDDGLIAIHVAYRVRCSSARVVGHVNGPVGRGFEMAMQPTAISSRIHDCRRAEGKSAVIAASTPGIGDALRAVVDGVRVGRMWGRGRRRVGVVRAAADCLVVDVRWET